MISSSDLALGISLRMANDGDRLFLEQTYREARPELDLIDCERDYVELVKEQQMTALQEGIGDKYPNSVKFIIEKARHAIGAVVVNFGHNDLRVVFLACVPSARGFGYGRAALHGIQLAAEKTNLPVTLVALHSNPGSKRIYLEAGFRVAETSPIADLLVWYPGGSAPGTVLRA